MLYDNNPHYISYSRKHGNKTVSFNKNGGEDSSPGTGEKATILPFSCYYLTRYDISPQQFNVLGAYKFMSGKRAFKGLKDHVPSYMYELNQKRK